MFADIPSATNAMRTMQGFTFFEKPMVSTWRLGNIGVTYYIVLLIIFTRAFELPFNRWKLGTSPPIICSLRRSTD